jgi:hypothetical protein
MRIIVEAEPCRTILEWNSRRRRCWGWVGRFSSVLLLTAVLTGCGDGSASVSGRLTLDGQPLAGSNQVRATVMFYPESGGAPAAALADEQGRYRLATGARMGLAPGNYLVVISATESEPSTSEADTPKKRVITPAKYADPKQSGFRAEVKPGNNTFDFDMQSKPGKG